MKKEQEYRISWQDGDCPETETMIVKWHGLGNHFPCLSPNGAIDEDLKSGEIRMDLIIGIRKITVRPN